MITRSAYAYHPYYTAIIDFVLPLIDSGINITDVSTYEKTRRQRSTTASRKSTNDKNARKGKSKNKRTTQMTQDEEVSDTDTEQQNSEH